MLFCASIVGLGRCDRRAALLRRLCAATKRRDIPLSATPKSTASELAGFFSKLSLSCRATSCEYYVAFARLDKETEHRSTGFNAKTLTTTPLFWLNVADLVPAYNNIFRTKMNLQVTMTWMKEFHNRS